LRYTGASMCAESATSDERPHTLLIAPDSFKGTFTAGEVAAAIAGGAGPRTDTDQCPLADGGEGTLRVLLGALGGELLEREAHDPLGRPVLAELALTGDGTAIVEVAGASGLGLIAPGDLDAEAASSRGTGELIAAAAAAGAREIVIAAGGSATSDGGIGAIEAIDAAGGLGGARLTVLADVTTPFERAAEIYGPQKGADDGAVERLTARLNTLAESLPRDPRGIPMGGAAGGLSGGLWAAYRARLVPGAPYVLDAVGFGARLGRARAVITGEGRLDPQTLEGKVVFEVAQRCLHAGVPVHVVTGSCVLSAPELAPLELASVREAGTVDRLRQAGREIGRA
jgi:glycerate kinase